ncbi:NAD-dependent epimerase/dehydratase family protein [bacterium]|nr:NAD-dependent epimerase/dehydratase family protein [bacterium]
MKLKILVTGGAGFVGTNLCSALINQGHEVIAIDDLSNSHRAPNLKGLKFFKSDIADDYWMRDLAQFQIDVVFHLAAQSSNATSFRNPIDDLRRNLLATQSIISFCQQKNVRRLIFTSSMSVYGDPSQLPTPVTEETRPATYYAIHKDASEKYIKLQGDLNWTIFRLYTTYGFGQNLENLEQGLVKILLGFILRDEKIIVHGSLDRERDIIHVDDVVNALILSLENRQSYGKIYNLGTGTRMTIRQILNELIRLTGKNSSYPIQVCGGDKGDPFKTHADISEAVADLAWVPQITPKEGLKRTVEGYFWKNPL